MISNPRSNMNHATAAFVRRELEYKRSRALKALRSNQKQTVIMRLNPPPTPVYVVIFILAPAWLIAGSNGFTLN